VKRQIQKSIRAQRFLSLVNSKIAREGLWVSIGQFSSVIGTLFGLRILTELLSPTLFGEFTLGLTIAFFSTQIIFGPKANGIVRYYAIAQKEGKMQSYVHSINEILYRAAALTAILGSIVVCVLVAMQQHKWAVIVASATAVAICSGYSSVYSVLLNASRRRSLVAAHQGTEPWVKLACAFGATLLLGPHAASPLIGYAIGHAISITYLQRATRRLHSECLSPTEGERNWTMDIKAFSVPFMMFAIFTWANISSDRWALQHFAGANEVGLYAAAFMLGYSPMIIVSSMLVQLVTPIVYQTIGISSCSSSVLVAKRQCDVLSNVILALTSIGFFVTYLLHQSIFKIFIAEQYQSASYLIPWMILSGGIFAAGEAMAIFLNTTMKTKLQIAPKIVTALVGIGLNLYAAYLFGARGVTFSLLLFSFLYYIWIKIIVSKLMQK